jgi:hypothetical protein
VWCLIADVSEHCVCSIFIGEWISTCIWRWNRHSFPKRPYPLAYEDGTDTVFRNVHIHSPMKVEQTQCSETSIFTRLWRWNRHSVPKRPYSLAYEDGTQCFETSISASLWRWYRHSVPKRPYPLAYEDGTDSVPKRPYPLSYEDGTDSVFRNVHIHSPMKMEETQCSETSISSRLWRWNRHSVPKRRLLNTPRRGTTQKITRNVRRIVRFTLGLK